MAKKIRPQDVAAQLEWDLGRIAEFCADVMEDANDHNIAAAVRALNVRAYNLACDFIQLEKDQEVEGSLTSELSHRRDELLERLREATASDES